MNKTVTDKKRMPFEIKKILKNKWARVCSILLVISICASFFIFSFEDSVAYAAGPVLWSDKGKDKIEEIGKTEVARFDNGTDVTAPAIYSDSEWGEYVLGGINRVDEAHLPTTRPDKIEGVGVMDSYTEYYSQNVSILRYSGGVDSNLGISVNSEKSGYVKMETNTAVAGRYLYYSISTKSLSNSVGSYFGTFAVDVGSSKGIIARTETNSAGGEAFVGENNYHTSDSNINSWVTGYEYGCIDLMALTNSEGNSVKAVYLFGSSKTKVLLNYLVLSNTAPTKIDVANGNIPDVVGVGGKKGATRTYSDKSGKSGTATITLSNADAFNFENLVVDTKNTPYLYYSFEVVGTNSATAMFHYNKSASTYYYGKKTGNAVSKSVTGCVKISAVTGKTGLVNLASGDASAKGFCFSAGANIKINYLFLFSGVEITEGSHIVVKNAHATNTSYTPSYTLSNFSNGSLPLEYTYSNKVNPDGTKGVYAPFSFGLDSNLPIKYSWYVNTTNEMLGAKRVTDNTEVTVNNQDVNIKIKASIIEERFGETSIVTTLKLPNPDKRHSGLYFFCLVVSDANTSSPYEFKSIISASDMASLDGRWKFVSDYCRLDVADNIVYHKVNQNGVEKGILDEHWLIYGTDYKIKNNSDFEENGGYLTYNSYTAATATTKSEYKRDGADICDKGYKLIENYDYTNIEQSISGVKHLGWILFADTIRNPFGSFSLEEYVNFYNGIYSASKYGYNENDAYPSWTFATGEAFAMNGLPSSVVHDTTLNLYTKWEISVQTENLEVDIFVDEFGTTFSAVKTPDGYNTLQKPDGSAFINDTVYAAVAPKGDGTTATITSGNGKMQYSIDGMQTWVDLDSSESKLKDIYHKETDMEKVKDWYTENTVHSFDVIYALEINTDELLGAFGKLNTENGGITSEFKIEFRYIAGMAVEGSWFNFTGRAVCGSFNFIPFDYHELT